MTDGVRAPIKPTQFCIALKVAAASRAPTLWANRNKAGAGRRLLNKVLTTAAGA